ncbi:chitooligosaccharidolytic beta-N-acetylglucosaminidase-like [Microplitis mediator]|uniref:chitooligosaccharidolytic beta-N-acetylglucosaminidase-like n=1 Tax=Microplitis mediator TaxID=375433 RepID=UPI002555781E|nr:chitooligosaccharidolytic beta-N-acetylglucosaminidase-like [Microplitis mediator]
MKFVVAWILILVSSYSYSYYSADASSLGTHQTSFFRTFECINDQCQRTSKPISIIDPAQLKLKGHHTTLAACRLVCGSLGGLWPIPTGPITIGKNYLPTHPNEVRFGLQEVPRSTRSFLSEALDIFVGNLRWMCGENCEKANSSVKVHTKVISESLELDWSTDEEYTLQIFTKENKIDVIVTASTVFGARHALETLSQLFAPVLKSNTARGLVIVDQAKIQDKPIFVHRGLLIDTARNYLPVPAILRTIDGLAATKMNVLHWHATDTQSFPLHIKNRPLMSQYGAYSPEMIYSPEDLNYIVTYAKYRGVRIILELDSPSHAGAGWEWGESAGLGALAVCINKEPWRDFCIQPPCGQLNPVNPHTLEVLKDIYKDTLALLGTSSVIHLGGDEVFINCWNSTPEITTAMQERGMGRTAEDFYQLWSEFHAEQVKLIDEIKEGRIDNVLLWSSALTSPDVIEKYLDKTRFIIQTWVESGSELPSELLQRGYKLIMSTKDAWYLDHGFWGKTRYHSWRDAYNNRIPRNVGVLGGEVCMWGEYVNEGGLDSRIWPRTAAVGERLWSDSHTLRTEDVEPRLQAFRERLQVRQIYADAISPTWCAQHAKKCY